MDIVIPLGCRKNDFEIKYALRSIEKYLTGYKDIYIVGNKRKWLTGVKYIKAEENYTEKQKSILLKLLAAARTKELSNPFIRWDDDHFLLKPLDVKDIKYWKWGNVDNLSIISQGTYKTTVINTSKYLKANGWGNSHFDIHTPIPFEKQKLLDLENEDWSKEYIIKSLYCNKYGIRGEDVRDLNFGKPFTREQIRKALEGRMFFSFNVHGLNGAMRDIMNELYPSPSKYEIQ